MFFKLSQMLFMNLILLENILNNYVVRITCPSIVDEMGFVKTNVVGHGHEIVTKTIHKTLIGSRG